MLLSVGNGMLIITWNCHGVKLMNYYQLIVLSKPSPAVNEKKKLQNMQDASDTCLFQDSASTHADLLSSSV